MNSAKSDERALRHVINSVFVSVLLLAALLAFGPAALAQKTGLDVPLVTPGPGWKTCPRCENQAHVDDERIKAHVDTRPFDKHDISGVWGNNGVPLDLKTLPAFTPYGPKLCEPPNTA